TSAAPSAAAARDVGTLSGAIADEAPTTQLPCPSAAAAAAALDVATTSRFRHTGQVERTPVAHWCTRPALLTPRSTALAVSNTGTTGAEDGVGRGGCIFRCVDHVRPSLITPPSTPPAVPDLGTTDVRDVAEQGCTVGARLAAAFSAIAVE
ncbi:hypothetical protein PLICRDRAFT_181135, partial [Plicaturopsis crispa FD-325 SS-3]